MTTQTDGKVVLKEMVEGLEGVAPGPWECDWTDTENDEGTFQSHLLWDKDSNVIADAINATATDIIMEHSGDFDENVDVIDVLAMNNFRHFARCSPDNIRAIAAYVDTLETNLAASIQAQGEYAAEIERLKAEQDAEQTEHDLISEWPNKDKEIFLLHEALRRYGDWSRMGTVEPQELQQAIDRAHSDASIRAMKEPTP